MLPPLIACCYCTAIVTVLELAVPIRTETVTAFPVEAFVGTWALTWYSPKNPGARPENAAVAETPPIVTVGVVVVTEGGEPEGATPVGG